MNEVEEYKGSWQLRRRNITPLPVPDVGKPSSGYISKMRRNDKYRKLFNLLLLTAIPTFIVIIQCILNLKEDLEMYRALHMVREGIQSSVQISEIINKVQIERGTTAFYLSTGGDSFVKQRLVTIYKHTNVALASTSEVTRIFDNPTFHTASECLEHITKFRNDLHPENTTVREVVEFYTSINTVLIAKMAEFVKIESLFHLWTDLIAYELLILCSEEVGIERALGSTYFARGFLPMQDLLWYTEKKVLGNRFLELSSGFSKYTKERLSTLANNTSLLDCIAQMRNKITNNINERPSVQSGTHWFDNMTTYINSLKNIQDGLGNRIIQRADDDKSGLEKNVIASAVQLFTTVIMMPIVVILVRNIVYISCELKERTSDLEEEKRQTEALLCELEDERKQTEELLYQLLPKSVAKTLMENGSVEPESFKSVTIMFSDVVGFTKIASFSTPMQVVQMLNTLYMTMDRHVENYDAYKVETIGDGYMVASGLPKRNGTKHVTEIAKLAIDLLSEKMQAPHRVHETIELRIGINTGPCVAGVVGLKMPRYCVFGDTVNTASRMESTGLPKRIQMTESSATKLKCQTSGKFVISERGKVDVKGKGLMRTFWLEGESL